MATAIETVVGPIATIELSPSLMHEHIVTRSAGAPSGPIPAATML
jgi:predicted metal-dependent phosphotriesterase family hydrolase